MFSLKFVLLVILWLLNLSVAELKNQKIHDNFESIPIELKKMPTGGWVFKDVEHEVYVMCVEYNQKTKMYTPPCSKIAEVLKNADLIEKNKVRYEQENPTNYEDDK